MILSPDLCSVVSVKKRKEKKRKENEIAQIKKRKLSKKSMSYDKLN